MIASTNGPETQSRWMILSEWVKRSGYSKDAFNGKRASGIWVEGKHWIKSPDGKIQVDWKEIERWIESNYEQQYLDQARRG